MKREGRGEEVGGFPHLIRRDGTVYVRGTALTTAEVADLLTCHHTIYDLEFQSFAVPPEAFEEALAFEGAQGGAD